MRTQSKKSAKSKSDDAFVPDEAVSSGAASYLKFEQGETTFRIISKPIFGWLAWVDKKPIRSHIDDEPEAEDEDNKPKKFMSVVVIDRDDNNVKIAEMTQQSVIKAIKALAANKAWGDPFTYDLTVTKSGESLKTKYTVQPNPKKALEKELQKAALAKRCNLDAVFEGLNPWEVEEGEETEYFFK